jgi:exonuclease VII large subunit
MLKKKFNQNYFIGIFICLLTISNFIYGQEKVKSEDAGNYFGKEVIVVGELSQVSTSRSGTTFLNIDGKYPNNKFTAVIFKDYKDVFKDVKKLVGKKVEIKGKVKEYKGIFEIILEKENQLKESKD